jgi:hypothetical protein
MHKNTVLWGCLAATIAVYLVFFSDGHKARKIQILLAVYPAGILPGTSTETMVFCLDKPYPLTSVKVVPSEEARTNRFAHPLWHLVAPAAAPPVKSFRYGAALAGMEPEVATALPEPLDADTTYSLQIETGNGLKGEITFQPPP